MIEPRVIKKYPNRRLYDTVESRYITLADIRRLVMEKIEFIVIDKKTQEDITRSILLQVIAEQEHSGEPLMSQDFLSQIIRCYGGTMHAMVGSYLEQSLKLLNNQQIRNADSGAKDLDSSETGSGLAQRNFDRWRSGQDEGYRSLNAAPSNSRSKEREAEGTAGKVTR